MHVPANTQPAHQVVAHQALHNPRCVPHLEDVGRVHEGMGGHSELAARREEVVDVLHLTQQQSVGQKEGTAGTRHGVKVRTREERGGEWRQTNRRVQMAWLLPARRRPVLL